MNECVVAQLLLRHGVLRTKILATSMGRRLFSLKTLVKDIRTVKAKDLRGNEMQNISYF